MNEIKICLSVLCKELKNICDVDIKSEHIRLAKFDEVGKENVTTLWQVLSSLCRLSTPKFRQFEDYGDVMYVKRCFACMQYQRLEFYELPSGKNCGSRELLIALAWLIAKENILEKLIYRKVQEFFVEMNSNAMQAIVERKKMKNFGRSLSNDDCLNYILFICGKLKRSVLRLYSHSEELVKFSHQIHQATQNTSGVPHLSVNETLFMLQNDIEPQFRVMASDLSSILNIHIKWNRCRGMFWKWMDTVLEIAQNDYRKERAQVQDERGTLMEVNQVFIESLKSQMKTTEDGECATKFLSCNGYFPNFIFLPDASLNHSSEVKQLQIKMEATLSLLKKSSKQEEMELYSLLKRIVERELGPAICIIPQMYS